MKIGKTEIRLFPAVLFLTVCVVGASMFLPHVVNFDQEVDGVRCWQFDYAGDDIEVYYKSSQGRPEKPYTLILHVNNFASNNGLDQIKTIELHYEGRRIDIIIFGKDRRTDQFVERRYFIGSQGELIKSFSQQKLEWEKTGEIGLRGKLSFAREGFFLYIGSRLSGDDDGLYRIFMTSFASKKLEIVKKGWKVTSLVQKDNSLFVGIFGGIIYRRVWASNKWETVFDSSEVSHGFAVTSLATLEDVVYAGTSGGVLASVNGGDSWKHSSPQEYKIMGLIAGRDSVLYAQTYNPDLVFESRDKGVTWEQIFSGFLNSMVISSSRFFAVFEGENWLYFRDGSEGFEPWLPKNLQVNKVFSSEDMVFFTAFDRQALSNTQKLYYSSDEGESWTELNFPANMGKIQTVQVFGQSIFLVDKAGFYRAGFKN